MLSFALLLPFFVLLIWLAFISLPRQRKALTQLALVSLALSLLAAMLSFDLARKENYSLWPHVVSALTAFGSFLAIFGAGFLPLWRRRSAVEAIK